MNTYKNTSKLNLKEKFLIPVTLKDGQTKAAHVSLAAMGPQMVREVWHKVKRDVGDIFEMKELITIYWGLHQEKFGTYFKI